MKHPLIIVFLAFFIVLGANQFSTWVNGRYLHPPGMGFDGPKLIAAVAAYKHALEHNGTPVPDTVSLAQLLNRGLLKPEDVRAFAGWQASISLKADETTPKRSSCASSGPAGMMNWSSSPTEACNSPDA